MLRLYYPAISWDRIPGYKHYLSHRFFMIFSVFTVSVEKINSYEVPYAKPCLTPPL